MRDRIGIKETLLLLRTPLGIRKLLVQLSCPVNRWCMYVSRYITLMCMCAWHTLCCATSNIGAQTIGWTKTLRHTRDRQITYGSFLPHPRWASPGAVWIGASITRLEAAGLGCLKLSYGWHFCGESWRACCKQLRCWSTVDDCGERFPRTGYLYRWCKGRFEQSFRGVYSIYKYLGERCAHRSPLHDLAQTQTLEPTRATRADPAKYLGDRAYGKKRAKRLQMQEWKPPLKK